MVNDFKEQIGGTETSIVELLKLFRKRGHHVEQFTGDGNGKDFKKGKTSIKMLQLLFNIKYALKFRKILSKYKPDIIYVHNIFNELSPSFLIFCSKYPVIMNVHDNKLFFPVAMQNERTGQFCKQKLCRGCVNCIGLTGTIYEFIKRIVYQPLLNNIDLYIGNSTYINDIIRKLQIGKTVSITYFVRLLNVTPITNYKNLLYIGRISQEKGIIYAVKALPHILKKFPDTKLTIIGKGDYKPFLQEIIQKLKLEENVVFTDAIDHKYIQKAYNNATIVLFPSTWEEPFGKVGVEAMSVGRPVIASRVGGIPEWLKNNRTGYLIAPGNAEQIAKKAIKLLSDKQLINRMGKNARKRAEEFSIENHVKHLEIIFLKLLKQKQSKFF